MNYITSGTTNAEGKVRLIDDEAVEGEQIYRLGKGETAVKLADQEINVETLTGVTLSPMNIFDSIHQVHGDGKTLKFKALGAYQGSDEDKSGYVFDIQANYTEHGVSKTISDKIKTNTSGIAYWDYPCKGRGKTEVVAVCGLWGYSYSFHDVIQYWNPGGSLNEEYKIFEGKVQKLVNYYHLEQVSDNGQVLIGLNKGEVMDKDWNLTCSVNSGTRSFIFKYGLWKQEGDIPYMIVRTFQVNIDANDTIYISKSNGVLSLRINHNKIDEFVLDEAWTDYVPIFGFSKAMGKGTFLNLYDLTFEGC